MDTETTNNNKITNNHFYPDGGINYEYEPEEPDRTDINVRSSNDNRTYVSTPIRITNTSPRTLLPEMILALLGAGLVAMGTALALGFVAIGAVVVSVIAAVTSLVTGAGFLLYSVIRTLDHAIVPVLRYRAVIKSQEHELTLEELRHYHRMQEMFARAQLQAPVMIEVKEVKQEQKALPKPEETWNFDFAQVEEKVRVGR